MPIGSNIIYREKVSSTNDLARQMEKDGLVGDGTVIYASEQVDGKGHAGSKWISEAGMNLTFSTILHPDFLPAGHQFMISKIVSLAILDSLDQHTEQLSIKWPNDIYHRDDKIAGILIESSILGNNINNCICGIGININQTDFPGELPNPVSLSIITGAEYNLDEMLSVLCVNLEKWYSILKDLNFELINKVYHSRLYRINELSGFITSGDVFEGYIKGVDEYGRLIIQDNTGSTRIFNFKEIEFRN